MTTRTRKEGHPDMKRIKAWGIGLVVFLGWLMLYAQAANAIDLFWWLRR